MSKTHQVYFFSKTKQPTLEIRKENDVAQTVQFFQIGAGRQPGEVLWRAEFSYTSRAIWQFRIRLYSGSYALKPFRDFITTHLDTLWVQDGQIFNYRPHPTISPSQVIKVFNFTGSLPTRDLYIYLPRGYVEQIDRFYPVIYLHDGQNCFEAFASDSFAGSWRADKVADALIAQGQMKECLIVGVSNGQARRLEEYLPPYVTCKPPAPSRVKRSKSHGKEPPASIPITGRANETVAYYRYEVAHYLKQHYRILSEREHTATCGSSMGGLFTTYIAWEHTEFAQHHAALSSSFWVTRNSDGILETIERLKTDEPKDIRLWLDSGTLDSPDKGDDGKLDTLAARDALLANGYQIGPDFQYYLAEGATHSEGAWAARLPLVFKFLMPIEQED